MPTPTRGTFRGEGGILPDKRQIMLGKRIEPRGCAIGKSTRLRKFSGKKMVAFGVGGVVVLVGTSNLVFVVGGHQWHPSITARKRKAALKRPRYKS